MIDILEIFKIGIGPSSSHTVGPMRIACDFVHRLAERGMKPERVRVTLRGSLSSTGIGHGTDSAVLLGLAGNEPATVDIDAIPSFIARVREAGELPLWGLDAPIRFDYDADMLFDDTNMPRHENGMTIRATAGGESFEAEYYSIGGGFFCRAEEFDRPAQSAGGESAMPYPFDTSEQLVAICKANALSISTVVRRNEEAIYPHDELDARLHEIWKVMRQSIDRGIRTEGMLPGPLKLPRRAIGLWRRLKSAGSLSNDPMIIIDWVNLFAFAVSEENASGGRVVTAPTNGACGVIPAVLAYYDKFVSPVDDDLCARFMLASGAIGGLYKKNASISGAEVGCQGEIGVACSMAAAGLTELLGGSPGQVCCAAEIGMEHCLGLTCDPVGGLVQVPCIERNAVMAVKAINAARMAMMRTTKPRVPLDSVIETMYLTGKDMSAKYRETAGGGLATTVHCG